MKSADFWIDRLKLQKHPEGGWFREIYRSPEIIDVSRSDENFAVKRNVATSIYYLLEGDDFSAFHRIQSDEIWHFYAGNSAIEILIIEQGRLKIHTLGNDPEIQEYFQIVVPINTWFAAHLKNRKGFALAGCTVSPGFQYEDFEMATHSLLKEFPELADDIILYLKD